jgi:hypothetical protein
MPQQTTDPLDPSHQVLQVLLTADAEDHLNDRVTLAIAAGGSRLDIGPRIADDVGDVAEQPWPVHPTDLDADGEGRIK